MGNDQTVRYPAVRRITDFDHLAELLPGWDGTFQQMTRGRFDALIQGARGRHAFAHFAQASQSILARGRERLPSVSVSLVVPRCANATWQGRRLDPGCLIVRGRDVETCHRSDKPGVSLSLAASEAEFRHAVRVVSRAEAPSVAWSAMCAPPAAFRRLESSVHHFLEAAAHGSGVHTQELIEAEQACLAAAAEAVTTATQPHPADLPSPTRARLVRRAGDLMQARLGLPTGEIDLCSQLGVSGRTLRLAFRERTGLGPMAYFQLLRLHAVRAALRCADPQAVSVSGLARQYGFTHPGKFAGYYRRLFGESPSNSVPPNSPGAAGRLPHDPRARRT